MTNYKGIILAGGSGSRLYPLTKSISKQLLPVYDKPMIYYPLSVLMLAGIKKILIITTPQDNENYKQLLGTGHQWGIHIVYSIQEEPKGLAQAFTIGETFIKNTPVCLILGDNIFYSEGLAEKLQQLTSKANGATIFGYYVNDPERYGIATFDKNNRIVGIEEKPSQPKSNFAIPGLYFYDSNVVEYAKTLVPSKRGELEITDLNNIYLQKNKLNIELLSRGTAWLDTGTFKSLLEAAMFVQVLEERQGLKIACLEEIAYRMNYINKNQLKSTIKIIKSDIYKKYLLKILKEGENESH